MTKKIIINGIEIDPKIFETGFVSHCDLAKCAGECCNKGTSVDGAEADRILHYSTSVKKYMDETQPSDEATWFDTEYEENEGFASGRATDTNVYNNKCVFKRNDGFCSLQAAGMGEGLGKWFLKPEICWLYPLAVENKVLTPDDVHAESLSYCGTACAQNHVSTVYEACTEELTYLLGDAGYRELDEYAKEYRKEHPRKKELVQVTI